MLPDSSKPVSDKTRKVQSNGSPQSSLSALGLDLLIEGLRLALVNNDKVVFRQLVSFLTPKPIKIGWS